MNTHVRIEIREDDRIMIKTEMVKIKDIIVEKDKDEIKEQTDSIIIASD